MTGVILATHGEFGNHLLSTLKMILGETEGIVSVALAQEDSIETFEGKMEEAARAVGAEGSGALVLVDMLGGTPFNVAMRMAQTRPLRVVTGVNLPMLIKAVSNREVENLDGFTAEVQRAARESVVTSVELLKKNV